MFHFNVNVMIIYTKELVQDKLSSDVNWISRGLVVLFNRQTEDEQDTSTTRSQNGRGFNKTDSGYLTYCSKWVLSGRQLSGTHLDKVSKKLPKYWRQILEEIEMKQEVS